MTKCFILQKECKKIGVRAMPKKKMVSVLEHVYQETHQCVYQISK